MSAEHFNPVPGGDAGGAQPPPESRASGEHSSATLHLQIDPQQQFREYTSPGRGAASAPQYPPAYTTPGFYQSGNGGQPAGAPGPYSPGQRGPATGMPGQYWSGQNSQPGGIPAYPPYAAYPGAWPGQGGYAGQAPFYGGYHPSLPYPPYAGYPGYPGYGYAWPMQPKRDTYLLVVGIVAFASSCLAILGGLACLALIGLVSLAATSTASTISGNSLFSSILLLLTLAIAGIVGGGFCMYHSIRSLFLRKASHTVWLPRFWIFLLCYLATLGIGFALHTQGLDVSSPVLTSVLIYLGAAFPALTIMALGIRRLSFAKTKRQQGGAQKQTLAADPAREKRRAQWPTSWRRFTLALVSGATMSIVLASVLELVLELLMVGTQSGALTQYISDPNSGNPPSSLYGLLLLLLSVIAPLVEEMVKPLAVVVLIGRVRSKAEAFTLGLACGIGFNLVETTGYISSGYNDWLTVALVRSGAGLLHGFGAAMVALAWYYLTHKEEGRWQRRLLLTLACAGYAVFQHALWNGSVGLVFIPGPIGSFFQNWSWNLGPLSLDGIELVNIVEVIGILIFFLYMSGRLRTRAKIPQDTQASGSGSGNLSTVSAQGIM